MTSPFAPLTELQGLSVQMHEMFMAFVSAGFTREEALQLLVAAVIQNKSNG